MVDFNGIKFKGKDDNFTELKGGIKREKIKDKSLLNIFDKVDTDHNHVLDSKEINIFQKEVAKSAEHGRDAKLSKNEADGYMESNNLEGKHDTLFKFLNTLSDESKNIKDSKTLPDGSVVTEYADGTTETVKKEGDSITKEVKQGTTTTTYKQNPSGEFEKTKETFVDPKDGSETITTFKEGKKVSSVKTNADNSIETVTFDDSGKEQSKVVSKDNGKIEEVYEYENGQPVLKSKVENKGAANEKTTTYIQNPDGTITEKSEDNTGSKEVIKKDGKIIKETINNNDGSSSVKEITDNKTVETITDSNGKTTVKTTEEKDGQTIVTVNDDKGETIEVSQNGKLQNQKKLVNGKEYSLSYTENGYAKDVVVQYGETAEKLAKKFGCTEEELLSANNMEAGQKIEVGQKIIIPKTGLQADDANLKDRKNSEDAIKYADKQERWKAQDKAYKAAGLKNYERSGEKFEYGGKKYTVIGTMKDRARLLVKDSKGNITVASHDNKILKDEYVQLTNAYDNGEKVKGIAKNKNGQRVDAGEYVRIGERDKHGRSIVVDKNGKQWIMAQDGTLIKADYVVKSNRIDQVSSNSNAAQTATANILDKQLSDATSAFDQQMAEDGWAGDVADGISVLWGSDNRASKVREDLAQYKNDITALKNAASKGGKEYAAQFKKMFGVEYNAHNIAVYEQYPTEENYKKAFGTKNNIAKRVADYNQSQQTGAAVVKGTATIAAGIAVGVATGGTGLVAMGVAAAGTAAASATINLSDRMSSDVGLKEGEATQIMTDAVIDGAMTFAGGAIGKGLGSVVKGTSTMAAVTRAGGNAIADVATGAAAEYMQTGEVTLEGTAMNAGLAMVGFGAESGAFKHAGQAIKNKFHKTSTPDIPTASTVHTNTRPTGDAPKYEVPKNESVLDKATRNSNNPNDVAPARSVGKLSDDKFNQLKTDLNNELSNISSLTDENLVKLQKQVEALSDRSQRRELEAMLNKKKMELATNPAPAKTEPETSTVPNKNDAEVDGTSSETANVKPDEIKADAALKSKFGDTLYALYERVLEGINHLRTIVDFTTLKSQIESSFAGFKEEMQDLLSKLNTKAKSIHLDTTNLPKIAKPKNNIFPKEIAFDNIKMSDRVLDQSGRGYLKGRSMGELLSPEQKKVYTDSYEAFLASKDLKITHNATNTITSNNLLHSTKLESLLDDGGILDNGIVPREITGKSTARLNGQNVDTLTPLCSDVWDVQGASAITDYFDAGSSHWNNKGELNFMQFKLPGKSISSIVVVLDKNSMSSQLVKNSFGVNQNGQSILFENGNMSRGHKYPTHRAIPIGAPSNSIEKIVIDPNWYGQSSIDALKNKIAKNGLDVKLFDYDGNLL